MKASKPSYAELEKKIAELEEENLHYKEVSSFLEVSEARFRSILDNSIAVIYLKDLEGRYLFINSRYEELFHVSKKDVIGKSDLDIFPKDIAEKFQENDREIIKNDVNLEFEELVPHDDGIHTYISIKFPLKKADGIIYAVCGISTDITERKRILELLQDAHDKLENRVDDRTSDLTEINEKLKNEIQERKAVEKSLNIYRYAVENSFDAIGMATSEGEHWYQNRAFTRLFGELTDHPSSVYVNKNIADEMFQVIMAGGQWSGEVQMKSCSGDEVTVKLRSYPIKDSKGEILALVGTHTDITAQKAVERELLLSEEKYRDLVERTPDLLYRTDLKGRIVFISPSGFRLSGYTEEESIGMEMAKEVYLHPEERDRFLKELSEKGFINNFEAELKRKDGSTWWASTNAQFYKDKDGNIQGVEGITRDITSQKNAEKEHEELSRQLNREDKMKSLGLMAGGIAHDLNNILSGIVSYPDFVLTKLSADSPLRRPLEVIKDSGQRAADVVSDLLTIARGVAAGKEVLNINQTIEDYTASAEHVSLVKKYPNVSFQNVLDRELLNILGSKIHIKKILMNLVTNAAESISLKGVVTVASGNRYLDKPLKGYDTINIGEYIMLSVTDTGSGIPEENLSRIFEPFYTKKVMGKSGTGLGLAVVWNAVQDHDAYINVESSFSGTTFSLYFQVHREKILDEKKPVPVENISGSGEVILVVDDEERQREIARELLDQLGYTVYSVSSGEEALEFLEKNHADLLILDMIMDPGIDGLETYKRIIKMKPTQKAVISSGYSETDRVLEAQSLGAGAYIKKPYVIETIGKAVKKELKQ